MDKKEPKEIIAIVLAAVIIGVWTLAALRALADSDYNMPDFLTPLMGSVVTWCFVGDVVRKVKGEQDDGQESEPERKDA